MDTSHSTFIAFLKTGGVFTLLILAVLIPSEMLVINHGRQLAYTEMTKRGNLLARHFATSAQVPLLSGDSLGLKLLVKGIDGEKNILYAFITDKKGNVLAHAGSIGAQEVLQLFARAKAPIIARGIFPGSNGPEGRAFLDISAPVFYHTTVIGSFHLGLSKDAIEQEMQDSASFLIRGFLLYGIPGFIFSLIVIFFCCRYAVGQVDGLLSGINKLYHNNSGVQIQKIPRGLFGDLASAFNRLSTSIEQTAEKDEMIPMNPRSMASLHQPTSRTKNLLPTQIIRNQITVLFAGVKGFKGYADDRSPEDVLVDLNEYFALAARIAAEHGGQVDKFIGDAVCCVFDSTPLKPDHAKRAVEAAINLQKFLTHPSQDGNDLFSKIGIGISTGVTLSGPVDALSNKVYTFIGESFKTAYSLNVLAGPGEIVMSKDVFQAIEHLVAVEPIPPREIMDRTEAWENFRLKGLLPGDDDDTPSR